MSTTSVSRLLSKLILSVLPFLISAKNLNEFFKNNDFYPYEEEIISILRRLDKNDDGRLTLKELKMGLKPKDFDITTNATPEQIIALFPKTFYENTYGTVGVVTCGEDLGTVCSDETLKIIEVTPYRLERFGPVSVGKSIKLFE